MTLKLSSAEHKQCLEEQLTQATQKLDAQSAQLVQYATDVPRIGAALARAGTDLSLAQSRMRSLDQSACKRNVWEGKLLSKTASLESTLRASSAALACTKIELEKTQDQVTLLKQRHKHQKLRANMFRNQATRGKASKTKAVEKFTQTRRSVL